MLRVLRHRGSDRPSQIALAIHRRLSAIRLLSQPRLRFSLLSQLSLKRAHALFQLRGFGLPLRCGEQSRSVTGPQALQLERKLSMYMADVSCFILFDLVKWPSHPQTNLVCPSLACFALSTCSLSRYEAANAFTSGPASNLRCFLVRLW